MNSSGNRPLRTLAQRLAAWLIFLSLGQALQLWATVTNSPVTISTNGPMSNRINLVFLSEGYQTNQLTQFLADATNAANNFFAVEPYAEYVSNFNVFAIGVSSTNSGSTHARVITNKT